MTIQTDKNGNIMIDFRGFDNSSIVSSVVDPIVKLFESWVGASVISVLAGSHLKVRISENAYRVICFENLVVKLNAYVKKGLFPVCWLAIGEGKFTVAITSDPEFPLGFVEKE